jgi:hypothetical protein
MACPFLLLVHRVSQQFDPFPIIYARISAHSFPPPTVPVISSIRSETTGLCTGKPDNYSSRPLQSSSKEPHCSGRPKKSEPVLQITLVHGDILILSGDEFQVSGSRSDGQYTNEGLCPCTVSSKKDWDEYLYVSMLLL